MGLDNYFRLRDKRDGKSITIAYFRKFYELVNYFGIKSPGLRVISLTDITSLRQTLKPVVEILAQFSDEQIYYYDEMGYPNWFLSDQEDDPIRAKTYFGFINGEFGVYSSRSSYIGSKILKLFSIVETLIEIVDNDYDSTYEIILSTSY